MEKPFTSSLTARWWGENARLTWLMLATALITMLMLGHHELWRDQEGRWAAIIGEMLLRHDYLHPYIGGLPYYDKPLGSYWASLLLTPFTGGFNEWSLRLPSALSCLAIVYCTYRLGAQLINRSTGLLAGWMLITCYFFIFWSRTAGADLLNLAGIMLAITWYFAKREQPNFWNYLVFFLIIAISCLFKGLVAAAVVIVALIPELVHNANWKKYLRISLVFAAIIAGIIYAIPFMLSSYDGGQSYGDSGLYKVYHENIVRFFKPFDHKNPVYTYFIELPTFLVPWIFLFLPAIWFNIKNWKKLSYGERWVAWATLLIFLFFTASGSRRNYYILPVLPFALLMTANWITTTLQNYPWRAKLSTAMIVILYSGIFAWFILLQPFTDRHDRGVWQFANTVHRAAEQIRPWSQWQVIVLDSAPKIIFYINPTNSPAKMIGIEQIPAETKNNHAILITIKANIEKVKPLLPNYQIILENDNQLFDSFGEKDSVAFIPKN